MIKNVIDIPVAYDNCTTVCETCPLNDYDQCSERVSLNVYKSEKASERFEFCPNCGFDMREEGDE